MTNPPQASPNTPRYRLAPGPVPATANDLRTAQERDQLLRTELPRVRQAATAWRNGLGALLAALIGFGLIKGRSDVSQLSPGWAVTVGVLLFAALLAGAVGALLLIRAAHGRPSVADVERIPPNQAGDHIEALVSADALRRGIALTLGCTLLLVAAVGTTWYGPERRKPALRVTGPTGTICGLVVRLNQGTLVLKTDAGEVSVNLSSAAAIAAVENC
ncbi:hypothetical protein AB0B10_24930 [Micromonospora arborensis]|uniref:hypothetical protein n=1 Tax=Micromonospora arborensis TaxID=2116518 RepID=UPI0033DB0B9A